MFYKFFFQRRAVHALTVFEENILCHLDSATKRNLREIAASLGGTQKHVSITLPARVYVSLLRLRDRQLVAASTDVTSKVPLYTITEKGRDALETLWRLHGAAD